MKKVIAFMFSFSIFIYSAHAQIRYQEGVNSILVFGKALGNEEDNIQGSKYLNDFELYSVNGSKEKYLIRYNALKDLMEYKSDDNKVLELSKEATKLLKGENKEYILVATEDSKLMYNEVVVSTNDIQILKFVSVSFVKAKQARNTYEDASPARYKKNKDQYFIYYNTKLYPFTGKQNELIAIFPNKAEMIKSFYKGKKIQVFDASILNLKDLLQSF